MNLGFLTKLQEIEFLVDKMTADAASRARSVEAIEKFLTAAEAELRLSSVRHDLDGLLRADERELGRSTSQSQFQNITSALLQMQSVLA